MKAKTLLFLAMVLVPALEWAPAQTSQPAQNPLAPPTEPQTLPTPRPSSQHVIDVPQPDQPPPTATASGPTEALDPAKVTEYQTRFDSGYALEQQGKLAEARAIYDAILAEQPQAKRSLLEAGRVSFKLGELTKANDYLEKLHAIVPDFPEAIELLIQINQQLHRDVRVEFLLRDFRALRDSGKVPALSKSIFFVRERIPLDQQTIVVSQGFDYSQDPNTVYMAGVFDNAGQLQRRILLNYDPQATQALRAKDAKYATVEVFTWFEHVLKDQRVTSIKAYLQIFALPDYAKFRSAMLIILSNPPTPIYTAPIDSTSQ